MLMTKNPDPPRLRSMSTKPKHHSFFLLVRVRSLKANFCFPIPLYLISLTLELIADFLWVIERLCPSCIDRNFSRHHKAAKIKPSQILKMLQALIYELRHYGRWRMVEVKVPKENTQVYLDFF